MATKDSSLYLVHIRDCVDRIVSYTSGKGREWTQEPMILDAVCRNLEIIGEAANKLGEPYRLLHPAIPWRRIIGARNILIHAYDIVQPEVLEDVVERDLPMLRQQIVKLLEHSTRTEPAL